MPRVPPPCSGRERCCPRGAPGREARAMRNASCTTMLPLLPKAPPENKTVCRARVPAPSSLEPVTQDARSLPRSPQERRIALEAVVGTDEGQSGGQPDPNRADGGEALHRICRIAQLVPVLCPSGSTHAALPLARARARAHTHTHSFSRARARARSALRLRLATRARSVVASTSTRTTRAPSSGA
jgi:hypothetical protein